MVKKRSGSGEGLLNGLVKVRGGDGDRVVWQKRGGGKGMGFRMVLRKRGAGKGMWMGDRTLWKREERVRGWGIEWCGEEWSG